MNQALRAFNQELTTLIRRVLPSTVTISGFSRDLSTESQGSGWIYSKELVVTNHHVVEGLADPMIVQPVGAAPLEGTLVGCDPENDIALLRVPGLRGAPLELEPTTPALGELSIAIGSPNSYRESASLGIISGLSRQIRRSDGGVIEEMIQTDASVIPGNSGGPLINIEGRVLGMNTLGPAETVNMAVPAETISHIVPELEAHGAILRSSIGITITLAQFRNNDGIRQAVAVKKVRNSDEVPLKSGDVLIEINGRPVSRRIDMIRALNRDTAEQRIAMVIERDGIRKTIEVLARAKASTNKP